MSAPQPRFERRLKWLTVAVGAPGSLTAVVLIWSGNHDASLRSMVTVLVLATWGIAAASLVHGVVFPLQTLANLLGGLREGDYSTRARAERFGMMPSAKS